VPHVSVVWSNATRHDTVISKKHNDPLCFQRPSPSNPPRAIRRHQTAATLRVMATLGADLGVVSRGDSVAVPQLGADAQGAHRTRSACNGSCRICLVFFSAIAWYPDTLVSERVW